MINTYTSVADYYDYIFPLNPLQVDFITNRLSPKTSPLLLDLGCGTGSLAMALSEHGFKTVGIDIDKRMIEIAQQKGKGYSNATFLVEDIGKIQRSFKAGSFDSIYSFGNSIVYLHDPEAIQSLFSTVKSLLKPGGKFIVEIVNYRRIFDKMVTCFPAIDNRQILFEGCYNFSGPGEPLYYKTATHIKSTGSVIENREKLYPLLPEEGVFFLETAGFNDVDFRGSANEDIFLSDSHSFIFIAQ